jgi:hypothetical protein
MAYRLVNRNTQIPNGYTYIQPETRWKPSRYPSFTSLVAQVQAHRKGNVHLAEKYPTDVSEIADEMDNYNAERCAKNGWTKYFQEDSNWQPSPKLAAIMQAEAEKQAIASGRSGLFRAAIRAYTGAVTIADWLGRDGKAVDTELSESRAQVCVGCPQNQQGDLTSFFTRPVANLIQKQIVERNNLKLSTTVDDKLGICGACGCPLKLKLHVPLKFITEHMREPEKNNLDKRCWILSETVV